MRRQVSPAQLAVAYALSPVARRHPFVVLGSLVSVVCCARVFDLFLLSDLCKCVARARDHTAHGGVAGTAQVAHLHELALGSALCISPVEISFLESGTSTQYRTTP